MSFFDFREPVNAWTHLSWMVLSVPCTLLLWRRSRGNLPKQLSLLVFGITLFFCYLSSTLFHSVRTPATIRFYHTIDHIGIYLLIAGTFTPPAVVFLRGLWRWSVLLGIWTMASAGIVMHVLDGDTPISIATSVYLTMGWGGIFFYFELARILSHRAVRPIILGGVFYSVGALINLAHWPDFYPDVFGHHEIFHLLVMTGTVLHVQFMLATVIPHEHRFESEAVFLPVVTQDLLAIDWDMQPTASAERMADVSTRTAAVKVQAR